MPYLVRVTGGRQLCPRPRGHLVVTDRAVRSPVPVEQHHPPLSVRPLTDRACAVWHIATARELAVDKERAVTLPARRLPTRHPSGLSCKEGWDSRQFRGRASPHSSFPAYTPLVRRAPWHPDHRRPCNHSTVKSIRATRRLAARRLIAEDGCWRSWSPSDGTLTRAMRASLSGRSRPPSRYGRSPETSSPRRARRHSLALSLRPGLRSRFGA